MLDYYCGVCRYALEHETWNDGTPDRFVHPLAVIQYIEPHDPDPIPLAEMIQVNMVCDFCSAPNPKWMLRFRGLAMTTAAPGYKRTDDLGEWWATCGQCRIAVRARDLHMLGARYARRHEKPMALVLEVIGPVWRPLVEGGILQELRRG